MEQILNANNYAMQNLTILNGNSNILQLASSNVGGIQTNCGVTVDGDLTCNTLNYTELNPPLAPYNINFNLINNGTVQNSATSYTSSPTEPYTGIITQNSIPNPSVSGTITLTNADSNNSVAIGFSTTNTTNPGYYLGVEYGIIFYSGENLLGNIINGNVGNYSPYNTLTLDFELKCVNGTLKVYINGNENVSLEQSLASANYYFTIGSYTNNSNCVMTNINVNETYSETLGEVLANGNSANGLNIDDVGTLACNSLTSSNLIEGYNIKANAYLIIGNDVGLSNLQLNYGDGTSSGNNFSIVGYADQYLIQQYKNSTLYNQPVQIDDVNFIKYKSNWIVYTKDGTNLYNILDSGNNPPSFKQIFNNLNNTVTGLTNSPNPLFYVPIYTTNNPYNYGVNFSEILFNSLNLMFTASSLFPNNLKATLYLASSNNASYNPNAGNSISINVVNTNGSASSSFNSSIPIVLYYNNTTQFNTLYLLVSFSAVVTCNLTVSNTNILISSYISNNPNGSIVWGN
jgi:hypothetical protein